MIKRIFTDTDGKGRWLIALCVIAVALAIILPVRALTASAAAGGYIGEDRAKSIALAHAGVTAEQATFFRTHLDRDDRRDVYDIEFYSGDAEYDYEIDAVNGIVIEYDMDIEQYTGNADTVGRDRGGDYADPNSTQQDGNTGAAAQPPAQDSANGSAAAGQPPAQGATGAESPPAQSGTDDGVYIGENRAQSIALEHAGLTADQTTILRTHLDRDDRREVYDVEFYSGYTEYDYEIDAVSGVILEYDIDYDD
jgi:uncharacterized membrane protein YkoI